MLCEKCKGRGLCGKPCKILARFRLLGKAKTHFSGSSPPEIFVGRIGYPEINTGILAPQETCDSEDYSLAETWHEKNYSIDKILELRGKLIYARFKTKIKPQLKDRFLNIMQEISMADKKVDTEIILKKPPRLEIDFSKQATIIANPAPLKFARLEENPSIPEKVNYLVGDTDVLASEAIQELYKSGIKTSNIIKILSAGLLGRKFSRKLVPTRWSIVATDDTLSKALLEKIRYYPELSTIQLFHGYYVGNHYEFLLLPSSFSFEVIEAYMKGSLWSPCELKFSQDYESFSGRKTYASQVTGAYYTARLATCEYLSRIKKQASVLVLREERPEYYAPLGVGILRELARKALSQTPETPESIEQAFQLMIPRLKLPVDLFRQQSWLLKNYKKQSKLSKYF